MMRIILSSASRSQEETTSLVGDGHSTTDTIFLKLFLYIKNTAVFAVDDDGLSIYLFSS